VSYNWNIEQGREANLALKSDGLVYALWRVCRADPADPKSTWAVEHLVWDSEGNPDNDGCYVRRFSTFGRALHWLYRLHFEPQVYVNERLSACGTVRLARRFAAVYRRQAA